MKKILKPIIKEYPPLNLYLEQIEEISKTLHDNDIKHTFKTADYEYDDLTTFTNSNLGKTIEQLEISSYNPHIRLDFEKLWAKVYFSSDDVIMTGIYHKVEKIINNSRRIFSFGYSYYFIWLIIFMNIGLTITNSKLNLIPKSIENGLFIISWAWNFKVLYIRLWKHSTINISRKNDNPNFFQRKKDELILTFITLVIGAVINYLLQPYLK
ncbi:MAG: hypothetical protein ACJA2M_002344 [Polaribacter sp.]|jgi:hypothetical protein